MYSCRRVPSLNSFQKQQVRRFVVTIRSGAQCTMRRDMGLGVLNKAGSASKGALSAIFAGTLGSFLATQAWRAFGERSAPLWLGSSGESFFIRLLSGIWRDVSGAFATCWPFAVAMAVIVLVVPIYDPRQPEAKLLSWYALRFGLWIVLATAYFAYATNGFRGSGLGWFFIGPIIAGGGEPWIHRGLWGSLKWIYRTDINFRGSLP